MCLFKKLISKNGKKENNRVKSVSKGDCFSRPVDDTPLQVGIATEVLFLLIFVLPISYFMIKYDFFDWWYEYTRIYESWELDEWSCAFVALSFAFAILAQIRFFLLIRMHKKLKNMAQELVEKEKNECHQKRMVALGNMARGLAHEINNSIQPLLGLGEFVKKGLEESGNEKHLAYMDTIMNGALHAHGVLDNVLQICHEKELYFEEHWVKAILLHTFNFCVSALPSGTQYVWGGLDNIEKSDERLFLSCDENGLRKILVNVLKNASDAMNGGGEVDISVERSVIDLGGEEVPAVSLKISDTGCGMDENTMQRIFDPFFTTKDVSEGTGLGLAGVQLLMQQHNGEISVESVPGEGTTFTLSFPVIVKPYIENKTGILSEK